MSTRLSSKERREEWYKVQFGSSFEISKSINVQKDFKKKKEFEAQNKIITKFVKSSMENSIKRIIDEMLVENDKNCDIDELKKDEERQKKILAIKRIIRDQLKNPESDIYKKLLSRVIEQVNIKIKMYDMQARKNIDKNSQGNEINNRGNNKENGPIIIDPKKQGCSGRIRKSFEILLNDTFSKENENNLKLEGFEDIEME